MKIPGLYVAKSLKVATTYPMMQTIGPIRAWGGFHTDGVAGGTVIATDGTYPLRAVLRFVAKPDTQLWHRGSNPSLFMPSDLYCTHVVLYAVDAKFTHHVQLTRTTLDNLPNIDMFELDLGGRCWTDTAATELERIHATLQIWSTQVSCPFATNLAACCEIMNALSCLTRRQFRH